MSKTLGWMKVRTPNQRRADALNETIRTLEAVRNQLDPVYEPYVPEEKPKGWFGRMCSRIVFWLDMIAVHYLVFVGLAILGLFLWGVIEGLIERLF